MRCSVCRRWLGRSRFELTEDTEARPETAHHWIVCAECKAAIDDEVERAGLGSAARLRIAIGIVAASRSRHTRLSIWDDEYWDNLSDSEINRLLIWLFAVAFVVHAVAFFAVAAYVAIAR